MRSWLSRERLKWLGLFFSFFFIMFATVFVLVNIFEKKQEARQAYLPIHQLDEISVNPRLWAANWPHHYDQYSRTADGTEFGGSEALPESKLEQMPWLKRMFAGYAFSIDYREARGHHYMLYDQTVTERVHQAKQSGACLHCHASTNVMYRKVGLESLGLPADKKALAEDFKFDAVLEGFKVLSRKTYHETLEILQQVPDGSGPGRIIEGTEGKGGAGYEGGAHPVSCIDCHDPQTMATRITRPGFLLGIDALAKSSEPVQHLPSIERWRKQQHLSAEEPRYDPNKEASRQEMRSLVCAQCHVEYYCGDQMDLTFPWGEGLKVEQMEQYWDQVSFDDGRDFFDYTHAETGAKLYKAQHPEFEMWSQGIHARRGVSCADCHMAYERVGAIKISNHHVQSPLNNIQRACQNCHNVSEAELKANVHQIQGRTSRLKERAAKALIDMLDAIKLGKSKGVSEQDLENVFSLQRKATWRLDFVVSENSKGFHAAQETARILGESIDYSRQAQNEVLRLMHSL